MNNKTAITTTSRAVLGAVIIKLRTDKKLKQKDLATIIGISASTWSRIERGDVGLSIEYLKGVAKALDMLSWDILQIADMTEKELIKYDIHINETSIIGTNIVMPVTGTLLVAMLDNILM